MIARHAQPLGDCYAFLKFERLDDANLQLQYEEQLMWTAALIEKLKVDHAIAQVDQVIRTEWTAVGNSELLADESAELAPRKILKGLT